MQTGEPTPTLNIPDAWATWFANPSSGPMPTPCDWVNDICDPPTLVPTLTPIPTPTVTIEPYPEPPQVELPPYPRPVVESAPRHITCIVIPWMGEDGWKKREVCYPNR